MWRDVQQFVWVEKALTCLEKDGYFGLWVLYYNIIIYNNKLPYYISHKLSQEVAKLWFNLYFNR